MNVPQNILLRSQFAGGMTGRVSSTSGMKEIRGVHAMNLLRELKVEAKDG